MATKAMKISALDIGVTQPIRSANGRTKKRPGCLQSVTGQYPGHAGPHRPVFCHDRVSNPDDLAIPGFQFETEAGRTAFLDEFRSGTAGVMSYADV